jgi:hypothetical protein
MKTFLFYFFRVLSLIFFLPVILIGIPAMVTIVISDYFDPDPFNLNNEK